MILEETAPETLAGSQIAGYNRPMPLQLRGWKPLHWFGLSGLGLILVAHPLLALNQPLQGRDSSAVVLQNRPIFIYRRALGSYSPAERAALARDRLAKVLEGPATGDSVRVEHLLGASTIVVSSTPILVLGPGDADSLAGEDIEVVAESAAARLRVAIDAERLAKAPGVLLRGALWVLLATMLLAVALQMIIKLRLVLLGWLHARAVRGVRSGKLGGFQLLDSEQIRLLLKHLTTALAWVAGLVLAEIWLSFSLGRFPYTAPWGQLLGTFLLTTLGNLALAALQAVPGLFTAVVILLFIRFLVRLTHGFFRAVQSGRVSVPWLHPDTAAPTDRIVATLLWLFGLVLCYPHLPGSESDAFKGVSVLLGLLVTIGSSGSINQIMSGFILVYARALRPGDYVRVGEFEGTVAEVGLVATRLRTPWQELVTIPNAVVLGAATTNYSRMERADTLWYRTSVTIGYDAPWRQVHAMLCQAAERTAGIKREPSPFVLQTALSDFYVEYTLNFKPENPAQRVFILSELHTHIQDAFNENGVQILSPHFMVQPDRPVVVPRERWWSQPATRTP
jgi:small-conductance mechanosensitive channel